MKPHNCNSVVLALALITGCGGSANKPGQDPDLGVVTLNVRVASGNALTLTSVDYSISGPSQYAGHLEAPSKSTTISSRIGDIAPGTYSISLTGHANEDASIICSGTAAGIAVQAGKAALANVSLVCSGSSAVADSGMVDIVATASMGPSGCPVFLNDSASALEIPADGTATSTTLTATASSSNPAATLNWTAPSGTLSSTTGSPVTYTCAQNTTTAVVPVTLWISNGASECALAWDVINIACTGVAPANGCIVYVATSGADTNDGSTWANALANVQPALDMAASKVSAGNCSSVDVWVAAGTYRPTHQTESADTRTATFQLVANVALYGGFSATESTLSARSVASNVTTLSGDIGIVNDTSDNSYHVVTGVTGATIDGFTITGGNADGYDTTLYYGGGMYNYIASPTVANCTFIGNSAYQGGGGLYNYIASPTVANCTFSGNSATAEGGGMRNDFSSPAVSNSTFSGNSASSSGGGMVNVYSSPTVTNCTFSGNSAYDGGGMDNSNSSSPAVINCTFLGNSAPFGGGMENSFSSPTVTDCTFSNNSSKAEGGGMYNYAASPIVTNCMFSGNSAAMRGGGIGNSNFSSLPTVTNCAFSTNSAGQEGGGMYNESSSPTVTNCTFSRNSAANGSGMFNYNSPSPTVTNCIFWNSTFPSGSEFNDTSASVTYSIVQGGYPGGTNIMNQDPRFVDANSGDLHLQPSSPAIDQGSNCSSVVPRTDSGGKARWDVASVTNAPGMAGVDLGAYEFQGHFVNGDTVIASCK